MALNPKQLLIQARKKIENPDQWEKRAWATDINGKPCNEASEQACSFCAYGAIKNVYWNSKSFTESPPFTVLQSVRELLEAQIPEGFPRSLVLYNDSSGITHESILRLFDRAIESL